MKITPLEIRQKTFKLKLRGYDKDEADAFLHSLSQEWERMNNETRELKARLEVAEQDVKRLRDVEASLYRTLKAAEETGSTLVDQSRKTAEMILKEAQMNAEGLMSDARYQAKAIIEEAEDIARETVESVRDEVRLVEQEYKSLENHFQNVFEELNKLANDTLEKVNKTSTRIVKPDFSKRAEAGPMLYESRRRSFEASVSSVAEKITLVHKETEVQTPVVQEPTPIESAPVVDEVPILVEEEVNSSNSDEVPTETIDEVKEVQLETSAEEIEPNLVEQNSQPEYRFETPIVQSVEPEVSADELPSPSNNELEIPSKTTDTATPPRTASFFDQL